MEYAIETWFERDRAYVGLYPADSDGQPDTNQEAIVEFWDDDLADMIDFGCIDPDNYLHSMIEYAKLHDLLAYHNRMSKRNGGD